MYNSLFEDNMVWNAVGYQRLSADDKDKEVSNSVVNQEKIIKKHIDKDNSLNLFKFYCDDGFTGTNFKRPSFIEMMNDIESGKANCIIVKDLSRFGREHIQVCNYLEHIFPNKGIRFIAIKENIDSYKYPKRMQGFEIPLLSVVHESYAIDTSRKTRSNLKAKRAAGKHVGAYVPYGYMRSPDDKNQLIIDREVYMNVEQIFNLYIAGKSGKEICKLFNETGVLCPTAYCVQKGLRKAKNEVSTKWNYRNIRQILSQEIYTGDLVQGKTTSYSHKVKRRISLPREKWDIVKGAHEQIVTHKKFEDVQRLLQMQSKKCIGAKVTPSILSGFLYCADCGKSMVRNTQVKSGVKYKKFCCSTSKKYGKDACLSHYIDEEVVIKVMLYCIKSHIESLGDISLVLNKLSAKQKADRSITYFEKQKCKATIDLGELENLIGELYKDYKTGLFNTSEYQDMKRTFESEKEQAKKRVESLTKQIHEVENLQIIHNTYIKDFIKHKNISTLTRNMVVSTIDKILVYNEKNIEIIFKYQNVYKKMQSIFEN
jgi:site-specific DNA recombinase